MFRFYVIVHRPSSIVSRQSSVFLCVLCGEILYGWTLTVPAFCAPKPPDAIALWRQSMRVGEETPMRARMSLTLWKEGRTVASEARIVQGTGGRYRQEYEAPPEARGRVVCFDGKDRWQYEPRRKRWTRTPMAARAEQTPPVDVSLTERSYRITLVSDQATAAGRAAYLLELTPRHAGKGRQRRWIDQKTFKTLRVETYEANGGLARMISYQQVTLPVQVSSAEFTPRRGPGTHTVTLSGRSGAPVPDAAAHARRVGLTAQEPLGFRLIQVFTNRVGQKSISHLLYSDGLETLSVFVKDGVSLPKAPPPHWRRVRINRLTAYQTTGAHADTLSWARGGRLYMAVSHLEPAALQAFVREQTR